ncbi:malate synthase A [Azospirillum rugosum]|uniref:Malate synthase n=1 Tax=Azospirillum rugosum TaxID=416170 RepID=A0ABS4SJZ2_9PROT|nr:malate synthase A [Azospirillum rugosum]MBP2292267.1 malate synthase [Azospirillum rugosum]MDQ0526026.1 malate synthase [Azospirillum rugosum]
MGTTISGLEILGPIKPGFDAILTPEALAFLAELEGRFGSERLRLLDVRAKRQALLDRGEKPGFLPETRAVREAEWTIAPLPHDLLDRRVEITGPVERKMIINALNSGAKVFMADFEDSLCPSWTNQVEGQINLRDAVRRTISHDDPATGKKYRLNDRTAVLKVRPRGWHLEEKHVLLDGEPISGALFDFALFAFHNARELLERGSGPYFYLPKLESHFEARLWNEVFTLAEDYLKIPHGSIKATVLIETILAAFEMDEILYELRDHSAGLNCGRWDYIFSFIKKFRNDPAAVLPDRAEVTMATHFLQSYSLLAIRTCHKRGAPAIGGMAAYIPVKDDPSANETAFSRVRADKEREVSNGHDGTWVAHPGLVPVAMEVFNTYMPTPNQIDRKRTDVTVAAADLLTVPDGPKTEKGLRNNVAVAIGYIEAWLRGIGCVPLFNLMEDAATAEISRTQVWQWLHHGAALDDGRPVTMELVDAVIDEELAAWKDRVGAAAFDVGQYEEAAVLFRDLVERKDFVDFLTLPAYDHIVAQGV